MLYNFGMSETHLNEMIFFPSLIYMFSYSFVSKFILTGLCFRHSSFAESQALYCLQPKSKFWLCWLNISHNIFIFVAKEKARWFSMQICAILVDFKNFLGCWWQILFWFLPTGFCFDIGKYFHLYTGYGWSHATLLKMVHRQHCIQRTKASQFSCSLTLEYHWYCWAG